MDEVLNTFDFWGITPIELAQFEFVESVATKRIDHTTRDLYGEIVEPQGGTSRQRSVWALCSQYQSGEFHQRVIRLEEAQKQFPSRVRRKGGV